MRGGGEDTVLESSSNSFSSCENANILRSVVMLSDFELVLLLLNV